MKNPLLAFPLLVALAAPFVLPTGCSSQEPGGGSDRLCTPGNYVFCRCADLREGTKLCAEDGQSFGECTCAPVEDTGVPVEDTEPDPDTGSSDPDTGATDAGADTGPKNDTCPGTVVAVDPGKDTVIEGDTTGASADYTGATGACAVATGPEHVWALIPTGTGTITLKVAGKGTMDPTVYVRETDCATGSQLRCGETTGPGGTETFSFNVVTGRTYWVFVDGKAGSSGAYTLTASLKPGSFCGDGKVDLNEACDDGNKTPGDGCSVDCKPEGDPAALGHCPGMPVHLWPGKTITLSGSTTPYAHSSQATGACTFGSVAQDRVYAVTVHQSGTLNALLESDFNAGLYVRSAPCATGTQLACANAVTGAGLEDLSIPVTDGKTYYLFVDGVASAKGSFTLLLGF